MKWQKYFLIAFSVFTAIVVAYLTYIYKTTGVPFYRHNETYRIVHSDTLPSNENMEKNYTEPFKKYSLIDEEELSFSHHDTIAPPFNSDNRQPALEPVNTLPLREK